MKNNFLIIVFLVFFSNNLLADDYDISAKNISLDKKNEITIFKESVVVRDEYSNVIKSDYAVYNGKLKKLDIKGNVLILTNEGYSIEASEVQLNQKLNIILSNKPSVIKDIQKNEIQLDNFEYQSDKNIFKSIGNVKIIDKFINIYKF